MRRLYGIGLVLVIAIGAVIANAGTLTTVNIPLGSPGAPVNISAGPSQKTLTYTGGLATDSFSVAYTYDDVNYLAVPNCRAQGAAFTCQLSGPAQYLATIGAAGLTGSLNVSWVFADSVSSVASTNQAINLPASGGAGTSFDTTTLSGLTQVLTLVYANGNPGSITQQGLPPPGTSSTNTPADQVAIEGSPDNTNWTALNGVNGPCYVTGSNAILQCYAGPRYLRARYVTGQGTWPPGCGDFCNQATLTLQMSDAQIAGGGGDGGSCSISGDAGIVATCANFGALLMASNQGYPLAIIGGQNVIFAETQDGGSFEFALNGSSASSLTVCASDGGQGGTQCTTTILTATTSSVFIQAPLVDIDAGNIFMNANNGTFQASAGTSLELSAGTGAIFSAGNGLTLEGGGASPTNVTNAVQIAAPYEFSNTTSGAFYNRGSTATHDCGASCTLSAAVLLSGVLITDDSNATTTAQFDSAADIVAAIPSGGAAIGDRFDVTFTSTAANTLTIVPGAGNTLNFPGWASGGAIGNGQTTFHFVITEVSPTPSVLIY